MRYSATLPANVQVTEPAKKLVASKFAESGITIYKEGSLDAAAIEKDKLIDNHYYAIANKVLPSPRTPLGCKRGTSTTLSPTHSASRQLMLLQPCPSRILPVASIFPIQPLVSHVWRRPH